MIYDRDTLSSDYDGQGGSPKAEVPGSFGANGWEPHYDEAPPLLPGGHERASQAYPYQHQPHPGRRIRRYIDEVDETDVNELHDSNFDSTPYPERPRRPILAAIVFFVLMASVGSGAASLWFYYGPDVSSNRASELDKITEAVSRLAEEHRKLAQAVSDLQLVQESFQKNAATREEDIQRLSGEALALRADLDGLRAAVPKAAAHPPIAQAPKNAAVLAQKKGSERKFAPPSQAESRPTTPSPGH